MRQYKMVIPTGNHMHYVFVYGTLKSTERAGDMMKRKGSEFIGQAISNGNKYSMFHVGFPYLCLARPDEAHGNVVGEVYRIPTKYRTCLDFYEGYPTHYTRQKRKFTLGNGKTIRAWVYLLNRRDDEHTPGLPVEPKNGLLNWNYDDFKDWELARRRQWLAWKNTVDNI